jgi:hypothetical protein
MKRLANWRMPLAKEFLQGQKRSFSWGTFDCALFACNCVLAETGEDPGASFRGGRYSTQAEAEALGSLSQIVEAVATQFRLPEIAAGHAGRGDLVLLDNRTVQGALAIVDLSGAYAVCPGSQGLIRVRRHRWKRAWRI